MSMAVFIQNTNSDLSNLKCSWIVLNADCGVFNCQRIGLRFIHLGMFVISFCFSGSPVILSRYTVGFMFYTCLHWIDLNFCGSSVRPDAQMKRNKFKKKTKNGNSSCRFDWTCRQDWLCFGSSALHSWICDLWQHLKAAQHWLRM